MVVPRGRRRTDVVDLLVVTLPGALPGELADQRRTSRSRGPVGQAAVGTAPGRSPLRDLAARRARWHCPSCRRLPRRGDRGRYRRSSDQAVRSWAHLGVRLCNRISASCPWASTTVRARGGLGRRTATPIGLPFGVTTHHTPPTLWPFMSPDGVASEGVERPVADLEHRVAVGIGDGGEQRGIEVTDVELTLDHGCGPVGKALAGAGRLAVDVLREHVQRHPVGVDEDRPDRRVGDADGRAADGERGRPLGCGGLGGRFRRLGRGDGRFGVAVAVRRRRRCCATGGTGSDESGRCESYERGTGRIGRAGAWW